MEWMLTLGVLVYIKVEIEFTWTGDQKHASYDEIHSITLSS